MPEEEKSYLIRFSVDHAAEGISWMDPAGRFVYVNEVECDRLGFSHDEMLSMTVFDIDPALSPEIWRTQFEALRKCGALIRETRHRTKAGKMLPIELSAKYIRCCEKEYCFAINRDIRFRKESEEIQKKLRDQLAGAMNIAQLGPWEYDVERDEFTFNDHFYKMFRTTAEEMGGYTMSSAEYNRRFVHPDDLPLLLQEAEKSETANDPHFDRRLEHRILYADGTTGYITVKYFIVKDAAGRKIKTYGVNQDISARRDMETALEYRRRFESLIAQISSELAGAGRDDIDSAINRAMASVGRFTGADRVCVFQFFGDGMHIDTAREWCAEGVPGGAETLEGSLLDEKLPWLAQSVRNRHAFHVPDTAALFPQARKDHDHFEDRKIKSILVLPLEAGTELMGFIGFDAVRQNRTWSEEDQNLLKFLGETISHVLRRARSEQEREKLIFDLQAALADVKTLSGLLPICSYCKKIRDDNGYWNMLESYIQEHSEAKFTHSLCMDCARKYYPEFVGGIKDK